MSWLKRRWARFLTRRLGDRCPECGLRVFPAGRLDHLGVVACDGFLPPQDRIDLREVHAADFEGSRLCGANVGLKTVFRDGGVVTCPACLTACVGEGTE